MNTPSFYSNGKLLITGEYLVLDGALSLAIPTLYGQSLTIRPTSEKQLSWKSVDEKGKPWFEVIYRLDSFKQDPTDFNIPNLLIGDRELVPPP
ncbi:MAG TPA: hypothetical protein VLZ54_02000, partial [Arenibacter sp.]|nr:hypothetical protein [Arenibacter sp.]